MKKYIIITRILVLFTLLSACEDAQFDLVNEGQQLVNIVAPSVISFLPDETQMINFEIGVTENPEVSVSGFKAYMKLVSPTQSGVSQEIELNVEGSTFNINRAELFSLFPIGGNTLDVLELEEGDQWEIRYVINLSDGREIIASKKTIIQYECVFDISGQYESISSGEYGDGLGGQDGDYQEIISTINITKNGLNSFRINDITFGLFPSEYLFPAVPLEFEMDCKIIDFNGEITVVVQNQPRDIYFSIYGEFDPQTRELNFEWSNSDGDLGFANLTLINN